ncbi:MAG: hypothetical protein HYR70_04125 [Chloroflexi bacterium]|nr:hypothetical protein [Chloroflexota bacterium]MBI3340743.1 hypothetical protein [Chloroflexota bacterium]
MDRLQLQHLLQTVQKYDIASNPIWCTPADNPGGDWLAVANQMTQGSWTKPCEFVATVFAAWDDEIKNITHLSLSTYRSAIRKDNRKLIFNLPADIAWAGQKAEWIFQQAGLSDPVIVVEEE